MCTLILPPPGDARPAGSAEHKKQKAKTRHKPEQAQELPLLNQEHEMATKVLQSNNWTTDPAGPSCSQAKHKHSLKNTGSERVNINCDLRNLSEKEHDVAIAAQEAMNNLAHDIYWLSSRNPQLVSESLQRLTSMLQKMQPTGKPRSLTNTAPCGTKKEVQEPDTLTRVDKKEV
ncbi:hypothetical protein NDU88_005879 [Pleurodeles waltl]|uniref:Uncharacterized protein n=1 Tax=Pleurodeles waltl TaxID=8319 RepID=A0AAV7QH13_PLEWA|nr:hypothetical protein NDU88_005879 [Pleurodeles waltl]